MQCSETSFRPDNTPEASSGSIVASGEYTEKPPQVFILTVRQFLAVAECLVSGATKDKYENNEIPKEAPQNFDYIQL